MDLNHAPEDRRSELGTFAAIFHDHRDGKVWFVGADRVAVKIVLAVRIACEPGMRFTRAGFCCAGFACRREVEAT